MIREQLKRIRFLCQLNALLKSKIQERRAEKELNYYRKKVDRKLDENGDIKTKGICRGEKVVFEANA